MIDNNTNSLFHFTEYENFKNILNEGLKVRYVQEYFGDSFLGIPMISFCDIPLSRTDKHKKDYGNFAIGFDKKKLLDDESIIRLLNPVFYCHSRTLWDSIIFYKKQLDNINTNIYLYEVEHLSVQQLAKAGIGVSDKYYTELLNNRRLYNSILGFTKPYEYKNEKETICNYNECEWRIVIFEGDIIDGYPCKWKSELEYKVWISDETESKKKLCDAYFGVGIDEITHLIVDEENKIPSLIDYISSLDFKMMGQDINETQKKFLISRITSFQRIKGDY